MYLDSCFGLYPCAKSGAGIEDFFKAVAEGTVEYETEYLPELEKKREERAQEEVERQKQSMDRLMKDLSLEKKKDGKAPAEAQKGGAQAEMEN